MTVIIIMIIINKNCPGNVLCLLVVIYHIPHPELLPFSMICICICICPGNVHCLFVVICLSAVGGRSQNPVVYIHWSTNWPEGKWPVGNIATDWQYTMYIIHPGVFAICISHSEIKGNSNVLGGQSEGQAMPLAMGVKGEMGNPLK